MSFAQSVRDVRMGNGAFLAHLDVEAVGVEPGEIRSGTVQAVLYHASTGTSKGEIRLVSGSMLAGGTDFGNDKKVLMSAVFDDSDVSWNADVGLMSGKLEIHASARSRILTSEMTKSRERRVVGDIVDVERDVYNVQFDLSYLYNLASADAELAVDGSDLELSHLSGGKAIGESLIFRVVGGSVKFVGPIGVGELLDGSARLRSKLRLRPVMHPTLIGDPSVRERLDTLLATSRCLWAACGIEIDELKTLPWESETLARCGSGTAIVSDVVVPPDPSSIDLFVVKQVITDNGGMCGFPGDAQCRIAVSTQAADTILAHELGHALLLDHPDCSKCSGVAASSGSVMVPPVVLGSPSPMVNRRENCRRMKSSALTILPEIVQVPPKTPC